MNSSSVISVINPYVQIVALDDRQFFPLLFCLCFISGLLLITFLLKNFRSVFRNSNESVI